MKNEANIESEKCLGFTEEYAIYKPSVVMQIEGIGVLSRKQKLLPFLLKLRNLTLERGDRGGTKAYNLKKYQKVKSLPYITGIIKFF